jgi:hypothetical protein
MWPCVDFGSSLLLGTHDYDKKFTIISMNSGDGQGILRAADVPTSREGIDTYFHCQKSATGASGLTATAQGEVGGRGGGAQIRRKLPDGV